MTDELFAPMGALTLRGGEGGGEKDGGVKMAGGRGGGGDGEGESGGNLTSLSPPPHLTREQIERCERNKAAALQKKQELLLLRSNAK